MSDVSEYRRMQAFNAGKKAAEAGKPRESCNRQRGTIYFDDWQDGYGSVPASIRMTPTALRG